MAVVSPILMWTNVWHDIDCTFCNIPNLELNLLMSWTPGCKSLTAGSIASVPHNITQGLIPYRLHLPRTPNADILEGIIGARQKAFAP